MIIFLFIVVVIVALGATALAYRNRPANSIESGISSFRREMRALAPPGQRRRPASDVADQGAGVGEQGAASPTEPPAEPESNGHAPGDG